jgi:hypothetical protein
MSGVVVCKKHEQQYGVLACRHVWDAVQVGTREAVKYSRVSVDFTGDGSGKLNFVVCDVCIQQFSIVSGQGLSAEEAEKPGRFPETGPICSECLFEYENADAVQ